MHETDEILYRRFLREEQEEDLRILLERHREGLTLFLFGFVRNMEDAEELMLDALLLQPPARPVFPGAVPLKPGSSPSAGTRP